MRKFGAVWGVVAAIACVVAFIYVWPNPTPSTHPELAEAVSAARVPKVESPPPTTLVSATSEASPSFEVDDAKQREWWGKIVNALSMRNDAESLAAAALLSGLPKANPESTPSSRKKMMSLLARAAVLASNNAAIQTLALEVCYGVPDCDPLQYENALRSIDPKNALGWMGDVGRADKSKDGSAVGAALAEMSKAERFDLYWAANIGSVIRAVESVPIAPPDSPVPQHPATFHFEIAVGTIGAAAALALPSFSPLTRNCKSTQVFAAECARIGLALEHGDTILSQSVGLGIEKNSAALGSAEATRVADAKRQLDWLMHVQGQVSTSVPDSTHWFQLLEETRNEVNATKTWLTERGLSVKPPPDWSPENAN